MVHVALPKKLINQLKIEPEIYIYISSAPNNSNETYTFMCMSRASRFASDKTALKLKYEI